MPSSKIGVEKFTNNMEISILEIFGLDNFWPLPKRKMPDGKVPFGYPHSGKFPYKKTSYSCIGPKVGPPDVCDERKKDRRTGMVGDTLYT